MNVRLRMYKVCYSNLGVIYAKGLLTEHTACSRLVSRQREHKKALLGLLFPYSLIFDKLTDWEQFINSC